MSIILKENGTMQEEANRQMQENNVRILALEDDLESIYEVEMESGSYISFVKGDFYRSTVIDKLVSPTDYFEDLRANIDAVIYPEDRDALYHTLTREAIRKELTDNDHFDHYYRLITEKGPVWFRVRISYKDAEKKSIIIGAFNASKEMAAKQKEEQQQKELLSRMAGDDSVYIIDCVKNTRKTIHERSFGDRWSDDKAYSALVSEYIDECVVPSDRSMMREMTSCEYMLDRAGSEQEYVVRFRDITMGRPRYSEMRVLRYSDTEVLQSFRNVDKQVSRELAQSAISGDCFAIYLIDLSNDLIKVVKRSWAYRGDSGLMENSYSKIMGEYIAGLDGKTARDWAGLDTADGVRQFLSTQDKREFIFESPYRNSRLSRVTWYVLDRVGGEANTVCMAFADLDAEEADRERLNEQIAVQKARLEEEQRRTDLLHAIVHSGKWSFFVNAADEITRAEYSEEVQRLINNDIPAEGYAWAEIVHPGDKEAAVAAFNAAIADHSCRTPYDVNYRMRDRNGVYHWFHSAGRVMRDRNGDGEFFGIHTDITDQVEEQQRRLLGAVRLSDDVLAKANIGLWAFELDEGQPPRMYDDETMLGLVGLDHQVPPEEAYHAWYDHIDPDSYDLVTDAVNKMCSGEHAEVQYPWHHPDGHTMIVRCGGVRNFEYTKGIRIEGTHQDVTATLHYDEEEISRLKNAEIRLQHEQLRSEVLSFMINNTDDPIELLKKYAERLRMLIGCDQVIYRDLEETRIMVNSPAIEKSWAVPIEFCRQCQHFDAHHPMYAGGFTEMENCQEGWQGIPVYHDCPIKSSLTRIVYCDGEVAGYLAIHYVQDYHQFTDIERKTIEEFSRILSISLSRYTARKRAGEADSVKRTLNMMFSLSNQFDPIIVVDPVSGEYDWMMSAADDVIVNTSMTLHGENLYKNIAVDSASIIHEEDRERFREFYTPENLMKIAETGEPMELEVRWFIQTEGCYKWKFNKAVRMKDENGKVFVVIGVTDTTAARQKEEEENARQKFIQEQQALSDGLAREYHTVWLVDGFGEHKLHLFRSTGKKTVRRAVQRGLDEPTYDGTMVKYVMDSVHEDDRERVLEASRFETVVRETPDVGTYVVSYKRYCDDLGNIDYHQMCFAKAVSQDGTVNYILAFRDADKMLREQIAQQKQLAEALSMAESANRAKTTFLNNMSHDIRTPMNAIIGYTGLAASHIDNKQQVQDYLGKISQSSAHLLSLINDVLDMSRIESGKMNLDEKEENLSDIIHTLRDIVQADIHSKQLEFFVDAVDVNDEAIICDKLRLNQILLNILSNAIKYTASGGTVTMRVTEKAVKPNGYASYEFVVKDNGMGMDREFLKTIFDPFTRVKSSTVSGIQGTGLGMAITKNIIDMMGGNIDIESEPGKGTQVTVRFDFKLQSAPKEPAEIPELKGLRALVADDDPNTCLSICNMVEDIGMRFEWCTSGKEALSRALSLASIVSAR